MSHTLGKYAGTDVYVSSPDDWSANTLQRWLQDNSVQLALAVLDIGGLEDDLTEVAGVVTGHTTSIGTLTGDVSDLAGDIGDLETAISGLVPYAGAADDVDLGSNTLILGPVASEMKVVAKQENWPMVATGPAVFIAPESVLTSEIDIAYDEANPFVIYGNDREVFLACNGTGTPMAAEFSDGTNHFQSCDGGYSIKANGPVTVRALDENNNFAYLTLDADSLNALNMSANGCVVQLGNYDSGLSSALAGSFSANGNTVHLCDATNAIDITGDVSIRGTGLFSGMYLNIEMIETVGAYMPALTPYTGADPYMAVRGSLLLQNTDASTYSRLTFSDSAGEMLSEIYMSDDGVLHYSNNSSLHSFVGYVEMLGGYLAVGDVSDMTDPWVILANPDVPGQALEAKGSVLITGSAQVDDNSGNIVTMCGGGDFALEVTGDTNFTGDVQIGNSLGVTNAISGKLRNTATNAGAPTGGADGDIVIDTTNSRLYVKIGGTWKYAALT